MSQAKSGKVKEIQLLVSDEKAPLVPVKPGQSFEVVSVSLVEPGSGKAKPIAARLCSGGGTCIAVIDISE